MRKSNTSKCYKIAAVIISLMMLAIVLFSAFYIAVETDHDCCGEDCLICACIQLCENTLRVFSSAEAIHLSVIIPVLFVLLITAILSAAIPQETPVSSKVRLNN